MREYDNVIPLSFCDELTHLFEVSRYQQVIDNDYKPFFTEVNLTRHYPHLFNKMVDITLPVIEKYRSDFTKETKFWQKDIALEEFRIKRYNANTGEQFADHVDAASLESAKRYLAFLFYLNDDFVGGETLFLPDKQVEPKKGSVVVFPPTWQYPHAGLPLMKGTKYIMSTYLNFT